MVEIKNWTFCGLITQKVVFWTLRSCQQTSSKGLLFTGSGFRTTFLCTWSESLYIWHTLCHILPLQNSYEFSKPFWPNVEACSSFYKFSGTKVLADRCQQAGMSNPLPYCSQDHHFPLLDTPTPPTSSLDTLLACGASCILV
jgi:hypothetical protein